MGFVISLYILALSGAKRGTHSLQWMIKIKLFSNLSMKASLSQQFEIESIKRKIDSTTNVQELQQLARQLADLYLKQRAATAWVISNK